MEKYKLFYSAARVVYFVSNLGNVKTVNKSSKNVRYLKLSTSFTCKYDKIGYLIFGTKIKGKTKSNHVHCAVIKLFGSKKPSKNHEINHIDGNKHNNNIINLEWVTRSQNTREAYKLGLIKKPNLNGSKNPNYGNYKYSKTLIKYALKLVKQGNSLGCASKLTGINYKNLWHYKKIEEKLS
jgi:hypothetical protein